MCKTLSCFFLNLCQRLARAFAKPAAMKHFEQVAPIASGHEINCVLVHAFSLGSEPAFRSIYDHYAPAIYRVSARYFQSEQLAEELVQQVFSALWFKRAKFSEPEEVKLFLFTTAKNLAMKYLKEMAEEARGTKEPGN